MKLTLTKVLRTDKSKDGTPYKTKDGRPYTRLLLQAQEYDTNWISGFANNDNKDWQEGDTVEADVETVEKNGNTYYNLKNVSRLDRLEQRVEALEKQAKKESLGEEEINVDDIPY